MLSKINTIELFHLRHKPSEKALHIGMLLIFKNLRALSDISLFTGLHDGAYEQSQVRPSFLIRAQENFIPCRIVCLNESIAVSICLTLCCQLE